MTINPEPISFRDDLDRALVVTSTMAKKRKIQIHDATDDNDQYWVMADSLRLRQIIINLISNAVKYSPIGSLVIVNLVKIDGKIRFSVKDSGQGIAEENLTLIFEPFTRLGDKRDEVDGVGIGLAITRKLVEIMNGRIIVESIVGQGSTFSIEFDEVSSNEKPANEVSPGFDRADSDQGANNDDLAPARVLYIEDNKANQVYVQHIFKRRPNFQLECVDTGLEGVNRARENKPAIILTDILLPDISGHEVLQELKKHSETESIPVIAVSANATETDLHHGEESGFVSYLTKPLGISELLETIDNLLKCDTT
jgi:CheY-like chemotaxis protein